ncbi:hypothetical protein DL96DRAFT_552855 [Flagelloscypha sp. PMI_526]|nr:hypothetical protein DL96DRAFT_552855 [Flagelloscypha sp. PMI_526]
MPQPGTAIPNRFDMKFVKFSLRHQILLLPALLLLLYVYGIGYFVAYAAAVVLATPVLLHLTYPTLFRPSITTDLQKPLGLSLVIGASLVAALIQSCPRGRENATIMRVMVLIELLHNGSPAEKEQVASYLRWIKRAGLSDARTAEIIETVTWMLLEFDARFGYHMSTRRRDAIVMQCSCVGMRVGVPSDLLTTDYESFQGRLSSLSDWQGTIQQDELDLRSLRASSLWQKLALFMAEDLLPPHLRGNGECTRSHFSGRNLLRSSVHMFLWLAFPVLSWIPLRTIIGFITVVHDDSRHLVNAILDDVLAMNVGENLPLKPQTVGDREPSYISWLEDEAQDVPLLNAILKSTLKTQAQCSVFNVFSWVSLFFSIFFPNRSTPAKNYAYHRDL